jgi:hypothetical protein
MRPRFETKLRPKKKRAHATLEEEGAGKTGCALHPRSRVHVAHQENAHEHTGPSLRNGFTAYFVLSPATGLFVTVAGVMRKHLANLTPASGRQDHTTSPYASASFVNCADRVHRNPSQRQ